jgi:hypothetical protein
VSSAWGGGPLDATPDAGRRSPIWHRIRRLALPAGSVAAGLVPPGEGAGRQRFDANKAFVYWISMMPK